MTGPRGSRLLALSALLVFVSAGAKLLAQSNNTTQSSSAAPAGKAPDSHSQATGSTVTGDQLQTLPIPSRNWQEFLLDPQVPGSESEDADEPTQSSRRSPAVTLDGAPAGLVFGTTGKRRSAGSSLIAPGASESAVRAVRVVGY